MSERYAEATGRRKDGWRDVPIAGIITDAGNAETYHTGDWRTFRPVHSKEKCTNCLQCWVFCPDSAVIVRDGKVEGIDLLHCKGCGICAHECPKKVRAIEMKPESEFEEARP